MMNSHLQSYVIEGQKRATNQIGNLLMTYGNLHKNTTTDKQIRNKVSVTVKNIEIYKVHSCRKISTSEAERKLVPLRDILKGGCCSNEHTFRIF